MSLHLWGRAHTLAASHPNNSNMKHKETYIDELMGKMSLEQKVGQLMVLGFCGPIITPDIVELIKKYHVGGLRISQKFRYMSITHDVKPGTQPDESTSRSIYYPEGTHRDFSQFKAPTSASASEYAKVLNKLRSISMDRELGIPIHFTADQEGAACDDLLGGQRLFPHPMGIVASGDPGLAYKVALASGRQLKASGVNMIHSPVLDVNTNPMNPEIGTRSYSGVTDEVIRYAKEAIRGYSDAGLVCTGKHFPGRGESISDAHWELPVVDLDYETLMDQHIRPYKELIEAGLPAVMSAHSRYPALGVNDIPASTSKRVITELLRDELGFKGLITTDNMMMGGILRKYEMVEAVIQIINAGHDLVLCRDETPLRLRILEGVVAAVKDGRIAESRIDESVIRILGMRHDQGLFNGDGIVDPAAAQKIIDDPQVVSATEEAAQKSTTLLRDREKLLPLFKDRKVLLVEQNFPTHEFSNNMYSHPGLLWEAMCRHSNNVSCVEIGYVPTDHDMVRVKRRIGEADILVMTNYYYHKNATSNSEMVREIMKSGKQIIVVANTPFPFAAPDEFGTVIVCYQPGGPEHMNAVADIIYSNH